MIDDYSRPAAPAVKPACETCRFWDAERAVTGPRYPDGLPSVTAACRRRAPLASIYWPIVAATDWCGEYEVKLEAK